MEEQTILLVEDDFLNRRLCRKVLVDNAYRVLEAKNATEAKSILNKEKIELAILDINLGEGERSGITIGQELAKQYGVPFLYLTAYDSPEIINRAIATTPYAYVTKPFKNTDLLTSVALAIRQGVKPNREILSIVVKDGEFNVDLPLADMYRPEKSLHILIKNPDTNLHIYFNPKYHLHLLNRMKRKRALLRSNSLGIIRSDSVIIRY